MSADLGLTGEQREVFAKLADVLIPAGSTMPSASAAGVAGPLLDLVLEARPDLRAPLERLIADATGQDPSQYVAVIQADDPEAFDVLATIVPGGYFMNDDVRDRIGYRGQRPKPFDPDAKDYLADGLLQSVIDRGTIYRPTPPPA